MAECFPEKSVCHGCEAFLGAEYRAVELTFTFTSLQLQRNILATCPRVTRFKIDWGDGEDNIENMPPSTLEDNSASNHMMSMDYNSVGKSLKDDVAEALLKASAPLLGTNGGNSCSNGLDLLNGRMTSEIKSSGAEPMQM